jgi:hypothetical protein
MPKRAASAARGVGEFFEQAECRRDLSECNDNINRPRTVLHRVRATAIVVLGMSDRYVGSDAGAGFIGPCATLAGQEYADARLVVSL